MRYVFDNCILDTECYELSRAGVQLPLRPKVFQLLAYLITHRDRVVLKDELVAHLWPNQFIGDAALKSCVIAARKVLGDQGHTQRLIQTLHGHGYRFVAEVSPDDPSPAGAPGPAPARGSAPATPGSAMETAPVTVTSPSTPIPAEQEYKQVTVLCGRLAHAATLATCLDPEVMHVLMHEVFALAPAEVTQPIAFRIPASRISVALSSCAFVVVNGGTKRSTFLNLPRTENIRPFVRQWR